MISLIGYSAGHGFRFAKCCENIHPAGAITAIVLEILLTAGAAFMFTRGVGVIAPSVLCGSTLLIEGAILIFLLKKKENSEVSSPGNHVESTEPPSIQIEEPPLIQINRPPIPIKIVDPEHQLERFEGLKKLGADATYSPVCDRFKNTNPTDRARVKIGLSQEWTNGAVIWDGDIQIQGPANKYHAELMWRLAAERGVKAIIRIGKEGLEFGCCLPYTPKINDSLTYNNTFGSARFGDIIRHTLIISQKELENSHPISKTIIRYQYGLNFNGEERDIFIFGFEEWPDHATADCADVFALIQALEGVGGPVIVHCKGGIGRSGTFAVCRRIYTLFMRARSEGRLPFEIDPAALVEELRTWRQGVVELRAQFAMIVSFIEYLNAQVVLF